MKTYKGYLIDLDGTVYRGEEKIESAVQFVNALHDKNIPYLFVTNNSVRTREDVSDKLNRMNIPSNPNHIMTSAIATATYIKKQTPHAACLVIGGTGLKDALEKEGLSILEGYSNYDYVVMGMDQDINYEKLTKACLAIRNGAQFISTNGDKAIPTERGFVPGNGSLTSVVSVSTGVEPIVIGKPEKIIMQEALTLIDLPSEDVLMIGDNYQTDILAGIHAQLDTLLVFSGITQYEELDNLPELPTYHTDSLEEWIKYL